MQKLSDFILTSDLKPTRALQQVLAFFSIKTELSLEQLIQITQKSWLRKDGNERWQSTRQTPITSELHGLFYDIGMTHAMYPSPASYDYILLLGSDLEGTRARIIFLNELFQNDIHSQKIIALGSDRPLDAHELISANTEIAMMQALCNQMLQQHFNKITFIEARGQNLTDHSFKRATTGDTIIKWLASNPNPGSCLLISDQPFIGYQDAVARSFLKQPWHIASCGPELYRQACLEDLLDTLARWIYQEHQNVTKN